MLPEKLLGPVKDEFTLKDVGSTLLHELARGERPAMLPFNSRISTRLPCLTIAKIVCMIHNGDWEGCYRQPVQDV